MSHQCGCGKAKSGPHGRGHGGHGGGICIQDIAALPAEEQKTLLQEKQQHLEERLTDVKERLARL
jgi:hypothetical protein